MGLDFSETMLAHARTQAAEVEFVHGDATALPFGDASFDAVVAAFLLLHLGTPERAVAEAARVLRQGGRAAFSVWDEPSRSRWIGVFLEAAMAAGAHPPAEVPDGPNFFRFADVDEFTALLEGAGLTDVHVETVSFGLEFDDRDELWEGLVAGAVRLRPLILGQTEELQRQIRERYDELLEAYRPGRVRRARLRQARGRNQGVTIADRPRPARGVGEPGDRDAELHRLRAGARGARRADVRGHGPPGAVAAGRGRAGERPRHPARCRWRAEPHVQRPPGHVVLGQGGVARARSGLPAEGVRRGRAALRAGHLEHEGRARLLRRGAARARRRRRAAAGGRARRGRERGDREVPVGRRAGRRVPRLRGRDAATS